MPTLALRRPNFPRPWAILGFALLAFSFAASDTSAQTGGFRGHFQRFYGQDFYDGQHKTTFIHRDFSKQFHAGYYGPAMLYGRQYIDESGYRTDPVFWLAGPSIRNPYNEGYSPSR